MNLFRLSIGGLVAMLATGPVLAAPTQGTLGSTSTGSLSISASVPNRVQITGLTDINFADADPTVSAVKAQNVCVWSNTASRGYTLTATGSGTGGAFTLASSAANPVPFSVEWSGTSAQSSGATLTAGAALTGLTSGATSPTCNSGPGSSASLIVRIGANDLQTMAAGANYGGTLTLLVAPQ